MRLSDYLKRIGWSGTEAPTLDTVGALMRAHNHSIPFENLDVQLGNPLTTSVEEAYDKIVERNRGGWCYEQNGVFGWALSEMGFEVQRVAASVMRAERGATSHANHLTLVVGLPNDEIRWLVDVGFGGSLLRPLRLEENAHDHVPYAVGLRQLDNSFWQFWESLDGDETSFDFEDVPGDERAMSVRCNYLQNDPESGFVKSFVCQIRRADSHVIQRGRVFSIVTSAGTQERLLDSGDELVAILRDEFNLVVPRAAGLWEKICDRHEQI